MRTCPHCVSSIPTAAIECAACGSHLNTKRLAVTTDAALMIVSLLFIGLAMALSLFGPATP